MSVIGVAELHQRRNSSWSGGKIKHVRAFMVECSDTLDGTRTAMVGASPSFFTLDNPSFAALTDADFENLLANSTLTIPVPGSTYPYDTRCKVTSVDASPVKEHDKIFEVVVEYESAELEELPQHPLDRAPRFTYGASEYTAPYFLDESQPLRKPFVNSVGSPFEQTYDREDGDIVITMVRNEDHFSPLEADEQKSTTNAEVTFLDGNGFDVGTLRLSLPTATKQSEIWLGETVDYYEVTRVFKAKRDGHTDRVLDYGYDQIFMQPGPSGTQVPVRSPILDGAGLRVSRPYPLDGEGHALPSPSGAAAELTFYPYRAASWTSLNLA
jgi:hypothetical protein